MTRALPLLAAAWLAVAPLPSPAQDDPVAPEDRHEPGDPLLPGPETMEGVADILRETLARLSARLGPWRDQLAEVLANPDGYEAPVILPNGDILIRRRQPEREPTPRPDSMAPEAEPEPGATVDL